jgi:hypothetical protein
LPPILFFLLEVFTALLMKCSWVDWLCYRRFGGTCCFHLHDSPRKVNVRSSEMSVTNLHHHISKDVASFSKLHTTWFTVLPSFKIWYSWNRCSVLDYVPDLVYVQREINIVERCSILEHQTPFFHKQFTAQNGTCPRSQAHFYHKNAKLLRWCYYYLALLPSQPACCR